MQNYRQPRGRPVCHGLLGLSGVVVDGFIFGKITEAESCAFGGAFVIAFDNSRAGLLWKESSTYYFRQICSPKSAGGEVSFPLPNDARENVRKNLESIPLQPKLRWLWRRSTCSSIDAASVASVSSAHPSPHAFASTPLPACPGLLVIRNCRLTEHATWLRTLCHPHSNPASEFSASPAYRILLRCAILTPTGELP
jgi:hypothetical protein